jgi:two-component system sensor kinase
MDVDNQTEALFRYIEVLSNIGNFFVMNAEGWYVSGTAANFSAYTKKGYADKPYFVASFERGEVYFGPPRSFLNNTVVSTYVAVPIESAAGERVGVLLGTTWLNELIENVANYPLEEDRIVYLVDNKGTVVAHSEIDLFALKEGPLSINYSNQPLTQAIMTGEAGAGREYKHKDISNFGTYAILESNGWGVVIETPMRVILAASRVLVRQLLLVNIVLFVFALLVSLVFARQIMAQQRKLEEERERLNTELKEHLVQLEVATRELEAFSYSVSHDLRAPLRAVDGFSRLLLTDYSNDVDEQGRHYLERVRAGAQTMGQLIDDLLDLSRIGRRQMDKKTTNLETIAQEVYKSLKDEWEGRKVKFSVHQCPPAFADPDLMRIVFMNLLSNALKFTRKRKAPEIEVGGERKDKETVFFVKDNGVGFHMKYVDKLFTPFQRLHRKEEYEGTGVGLATVQRIIHRHGGRIWVESKPNLGTTFYFTL